MRSRIRRVVPTLGLLLGGAYLVAGSAYGCGTHLGETLFTSADFCFIFDCQNGLLGGSVDPCAGVGDFSGQVPLFRDCPGFVGP